MDKNCSIEGCNMKGFARGYCVKHYQRWYRYGDVNYTSVGRGENRFGCLILTCDKEHYAKGYCATHYRRLRRHGHPDLNLNEKFYLKCEWCNEPTKFSRFCQNCWFSFYYHFRYDCDENYRKKWIKRSRDFRNSDEGRKYFREYRWKRKRKQNDEVACKLIYEHAQNPNVQNDPESLTTEFIEELCGVECEKLKREKEIDGK